jgi:hypothetical protein
MVGQAARPALKRARGLERPRHANVLSGCMGRAHRRDAQESAETPRIPPCSSCARPRQHGTRCGPNGSAPLWTRSHAEHDPTSPVTEHLRSPGSPAGCRPRSPLLARRHAREHAVELRERSHAALPVPARRPGAVQHPDELAEIPSVGRLVPALPAPTLLDLTQRPPELPPARLLKGARGGQELAQRAGARSGPAQTCSRARAPPMSSPSFPSAEVLPSAPDGIHAAAGRPDREAARPAPCPAADSRSIRVLDIAILPALTASVETASVQAFRRFCHFVQFWT